MADRPIVVAKVGGSLFDWPELPGRLRAWLDFQVAEGFAPVLVAGGGPFADAVRDLDRLHGLGDIASHDLAIRAMDVTAHALAAMVPGLVVVDGPDGAGDGGEGVPVVAVHRWLFSPNVADALPARWDVTSDSIAALLAVRLGAARLVLIKSVSIPPESGLPEAVALGLADKYLPTISKRVPTLRWLNLRAEPIGIPLPGRDHPFQEVDLFREPSSYTDPASRP
jgi:aspartokinase-like uncharacterized kinase